MSKTNTNKAAKADDNKQELKSKSVYVRGAICDVMFGKRSFKKGGDKVDKYRISIKAEREDMDKLAEAAEPYYEDTDDKWLPKWLTDPEAREYLNLASNYDIPAGMRGADKTIEELGNLYQYVNEHGNVNGSKCVIMLTLKPGAVYPSSILLKEIQHKTMADMFADYDEDDEADELPFT